jgi:FHS family glucose/mannose:H+ symporter-like MFS transporter
VAPELTGLIGYPVVFDKRIRLNSPEGKLKLNLLLHIIFFLSGIATVLIGQVLPVFARHFVLNDLQLSYFFPAQFAGSITGTFITSRLARRNQFKLATVIGGLTMAAGLLLMNVDSFEVCLIGFFINGAGIGLTLPAINIMVLELNMERSGPALSILNFCWGVGAIVSKPFVDLFSTHDATGLTTYILAVPLVAASLMLIRATSAAAPLNFDRADTVPENNMIWRMPAAWAIAFFNFIHVGFESGMGGWLTTYTNRIEGGPILKWVSPTLLYFTFFVMGRGVAPFLFRYLNENKMLFLGLGIMLAGIVLTLYASSVLALSIGAAVSGFGTSWIFPTNVSRFSKTFGPSATRRATPLFIAGTLGAVSVTWLIGYLSNKTGDLRYGMFVLAATVVMLIVLQVVLSLRLRTAKTF